MHAKEKIDQDRKEPNWLSTMFKTTKKIDRQSAKEREKAQKLKGSNTCSLPNSAALNQSSESESTLRGIQSSAPPQSARPTRGGAQSLLATTDQLQNVSLGDTFGFPVEQSASIPIGSVPLNVDLGNLQSTALQLNVEKFTQS